MTEIAPEYGVPPVLVAHGRRGILENAGTLFDT